ncbi:hypothetical protein OSTOST_25066, partial [Ostertagia ostertagi]
MLLILPSLLFFLVNVNARTAPRETLPEKIRNVLVAFHDGCHKDMVWNDDLANTTSGRQAQSNETRLVLKTWEKDRGKKAVHKAYEKLKDFLEANKDKVSFYI